MGRIHGYKITANVPGTGEVTLVTTTTLTTLLASTDHGVFSGLADDDHPQYILVDGSRSFTSTVGGVTPVASSDLTTKGYVDGLDHGVFSGLSDDDHTQYILVDGSREFTGDVTIGTGNDLYMGDATTSGTFRLTNVSGTLYLQKYNGSTWSNKDSWS